MKALLRTPDGLALVGAGAFLGITLIGFLLMDRSPDRVVALSNSPGGVEPTSPPLLSAEAVVSPEWTDPALGASSEDWVFDVFTPPVIYYDRESGRFSVSPPEMTAPDPDDVLGSPFGVSLVQVVRQPFRLQLVGYSGTQEDPLGIFADQLSGDGIVARAGHSFGGLDLELRTLVVRREDLIVPESMPLREIVAVGEVWDKREQRLIRLSSAHEAWRDRPVAEIRLEATGELRTVEVGNRIETPAGTFEFTGIFASPDTVTVVKHLSAGTRETLRLTPESPPEEQFGGDSIFETN
ncbi:MAG: hypothetical protein SynsKO_12060 [Synoicihabitans sp.]